MGMGMAARRYDRVAGAAYRMGGVFGDYLRVTARMPRSERARLRPAYDAVDIRHGHRQAPVGRS